MLLIAADPNAGPTPGTPESEAEMGQWFAYSQELATSGAMKSGDPLQAVETATTVRVRDGKVLHSDGPYAETKEVLGGYYIIDVANIDEALAWAAKVPNVGYGSVEVRPIQEIDFPT
jgi:hypothetical protein